MGNNAGNLKDKVRVADARAQPAVRAFASGPALAIATETVSRWLPIFGTDPDRPTQNSCVRLTASEYERDF